MKPKQKQTTQPEAGIQTTLLQVSGKQLNPSSATSHPLRHQATPFPLRHIRYVIKPRPLP